MKKPELLILLLALLAAVAKGYCAWTTIGSPDVLFFSEYGRIVAERGLPAVYREIPIYNHPPLPTEFIGFAYEHSGIAERIKGSTQVFGRILRLPGIVADFLLVLTLLWVRRKIGLPPWWLLGLFAVSPVSFMITGYHGNFDPFIALGLTLTAAACVANRPLLCGVLLGLTAQVKVIPLLIAPIFFFYWLHHRRVGTFTASAVLTTALGWIVPLLIFPVSFLTHVLGQNSIWGWWGVTFLLRSTGIAVFQSASPPYGPEQSTVILVCKMIIIGTVLALAWSRRRLPAEEVFKTIALAFLVFLVFAPGFGVQYLLWLPPFLLFVSPRWSTAVMAASTVGLFVFYDTISSGQMPWYVARVIQPHIATWGPWLLVPWSVLAACLLAQAMEFVRAKRTPPPSEA